MMRSLYELWLVPLAALFAMTPVVHAEDAAAPSIYIVRYVDVVPAAKGQGAELVRQLAEQSRKEAGMLRFDVLERTAPPNQFLILETWKDQAAADAHMAAAHTKQFLDMVQPILLAPIDNRFCFASDVGAAQSAAGKARYVVTHVDVFPPGKDTTVGLLKTLAAASRKEDGNLGFDILQQTKSPNHFEVVEIWKNRRNDDAHEVAAPAKEFRDKLAPLTGALYDQRWYRPL
jgi:quinol monooxygenase YgiN